MKFVIDTLAVTMKEAIMIRIVDRLERWADDYESTQVDPVARRYSAFQTLRLEMEKRMQKLREEAQDEKRTD